MYSSSGESSTYRGDPQAPGVCQRVCQASLNQGQGQTLALHANVCDMAAVLVALQQSNTDPLGPYKLLDEIFGGLAIALVHFGAIYGVQSNTTMVTASVDRLKRISVNYDNKLH